MQQDMFASTDSLLAFKAWLHATAFRFFGSPLLEMQLSVEVFFFHLLFRTSEFLEHLVL